jgi:hypothetical protein
MNNVIPVIGEDYRYLELKEPKAIVRLARVVQGNPYSVYWLTVIRPLTEGDPEFVPGRDFKVMGPFEKAGWDLERP